ncbi:MAG: hypothetical protein HOW73_49505 [Polyangiaceae bacterium]|nr:hypothetical protein [Polyangiaceae bacterium]
MIINDCDLPLPADANTLELKHCRTVETAAEFKKDLARNLPDAIRSAFLNARPTNLFCNYLGAALDNGTFVAWAWPPHDAADDTEMKIFALNLPGAKLLGWR